MAFFAVMLPNAFRDPASLKESITKRFNEMEVDEVKESQKQAVRLGQMVRDAIVTAAAMKGKPIPPSVSVPALAAPPPPPPAPARVDLRAMPLTTEAEIRAYWEALKSDKIKKLPGGRLATPASEAAADASFNAELTRILALPALPTPGVIAGKLRGISGTLRGGSRHRTPRRISKSKTFRH
jgi:hypothetical protein